MSEENRIRLLGCPSLTAGFTGRYFDREERITYYHRWVRGLPLDYPLIHPDFELRDYIFDNFSRLPPHLIEVPLEELLDILCQAMIEEASLQLKIVVNEDSTSIDIQEGVDLDSFSQLTFDYIRVSLAKQIYLRSPEQFERGLLTLVKQIRFAGDDYGLHAFADAIQLLYPYFCEGFDEWCKW